jgi:hypothetical protein
MATVTQNPAGTKGLRKYTLTSANDETQQQPVNQGDKLQITATGVSGGSTVNILFYTTPDATPVALDYNSTTDLTTDFSYGYEAFGKGFVSVKLTVDSGAPVVTFTR